MRRSCKFRAAGFVAALLAATTAAASAAESAADRSSTPHRYAGVQTLALVGLHRDIAGDQHGVGAGPLLEFRGGGERLAVHVEGLPVVSIPGTRPSLHYGQATPKLGIFNGELEFGTGPRSRLWLGLGETVYNERTPLPNLQQEVASRLGGVRYEVRYRIPQRAPGHFIEGIAAATPALFGSDHYWYSDGITPSVDKPERASEMDASVALGFRRRSTEWLFGVRALNFTAKYRATNEAADRNVGIGITIEWRRVSRE